MKLCSQILSSLSPKEPTYQFPLQIQISFGCIKYKQKNYAYYITQHRLISLDYINICQKLQRKVMQEIQTSIPAWLKPNNFIDLKDKQSDWRVSLILNVSKTQIKVRYDGWASKYDQTFPITSSSIQAFRSVIRGYTGPQEQPGVREHYTFSLGNLKDIYENQLIDFTENIYTKSQFEINQFIRGTHYTWIDHLMTLTYSNYDEISAVYEYFFKHFELLNRYLKDMLACDSLQLWFNGIVANMPNNQSNLQQRVKAFAQCYYEIFDSVYSIMDCCPRLRCFFKNNQTVIAQFIEGYTTHLQFMSTYIYEVEIHQLVEQAIEKILADKKSKISIYFLCAFTRLFASLEKIIRDKEKKKELTQKICQIILRECNKITQITRKQQQQIQKIYSICKMIMLKYIWKPQFFSKFQLANLHCWKCLIKSNKLQNKIKGINKIKSYYQILTNIHKKQSYMIFSAKQNIDSEIKNMEIINIIFCQNQHHEIIKKGCQLAFQLYREQGIGAKELEIIWKSCRHRLEAVRKIMYIFFETISKELKVDHLNLLVKWTIEELLVEEMDKYFYYSLFRNIVESSKQDKIPILKTLFQFSYKRLASYPQEMKQFSELLTAQKVELFGLTAQYLQQIIQTIQNSSSPNTLYFKLLNNLYDESNKKYLNFSNNSFNIVFDKFCHIVKSKIKPQQSQQYQSKSLKIKEMLTLIQNMTLNDFDFSIEYFQQIWELFSQQHNKYFREAIFLPWILNISHEGLLKNQVSVINKCLRDKELKAEIFSKILKQHSVIDYVNISEMQFRIFEKFMTEVNIDEDRFEQTSIKFISVSYFRIRKPAQNSSGINGLKQLWDIFMNARSEAVIRRIIKFLYALYLNYKSDVDIQFRCRKIQELLNKIYQNIDRGFKKQNTRIIKNALILLYQLVAQIKQTYKIPKEFTIFNPQIKQTKKHIKIIKNETQVRNLQANPTETVKSVKNTICKQFNIPSYNLKMYKVRVEYKIIDDQGRDISSSESSMSSVHTQSYFNQVDRRNSIKSETLEEVPKEMYPAPVFALILGENQGKIIIEQEENLIYQQITKYVCEKLSEFLLKILADTEQYSKQSAEMAYLILIEIPSNMQPTQILNHLIKQLASKIKQPSKSLNLQGQSINFRMYFCKNVNRLKDEEFIQFFDPKNATIYEDIFKQITIQIVQSLQIELLLEVIAVIKKGYAKNLISSQYLNSQDIMLCLINILEFLIRLKMSEQFKKQDQPSSNFNEIKIFMECFNLLEIMFNKNKSKIIDSIVQSQNFQKLMVYLYKITPKPEYSEIYAGKLQKYFAHASKQQGKLSQKTQEILCHVVFDVLYASVLTKKKSKNSAFFRIVKNIISISSRSTIQKLFESSIQIQDRKQTFWEICLSIIKNQSDFHTAEEKQNTFFSGHLQILESLVAKNPSSVDQNIWRIVFYDCLCYNEKYTEGEDIKCTSKNSIQAALSLLFSICLVQQKYIKRTIKQLRKYQFTKHWRNQDMWNVNINMDIKSSTGFVGLENPGCICYLNSFTQNLFMNEEFRNKVINFKMVEEGKDYSLLIEMRKLFLNLQYSLQKYLNPVPFSKTIKNNEDKPMIKIFEQMDIEEYSSILFDKIQKLLPKDEDFVKQIFEGTYSNDIISQECKHCSTREENFLSMQLDVKPTLQDSLKILVKGEMLEGQNAYFCEKCNKKVKALKRMSIKKLPNYLIICLKRFEYNFEIDHKIKVNSYCEFPKQISFEPYSQQFLNSLSVQQPQQSLQGEEPQSDSLPHEYFEYKLKGVIVHTGSADNGHYYTLIQVDPELGRWIQFNDTTVTEFDINKLADEAFGGDDPINPKFNNAYMLVYERKKKIPSKIQQKMQEQHQISCRSNQLQQKTQQPFINSPSQHFSEEAQKLYKQIWLDNKEIRTFYMMFNNEYKIFLQKIIKYLVKSNKGLHIQHEYIHSKNIINSEDKINDYGPVHIEADNFYSQETIQQIIKLYLQYCIFIRSREINLYNFVEKLTELEELLVMKVGQPIIDYFIHQLSQQLLINEIMLEVSFRDKLIVISHFIWEIIMIRLNNLSKPQQHSERIKFHILVLKFIESLMCVMIENGICLNQGMYIIRRLAEKYQEYLLCFEKIDVFGNVFQILAGINQSEADKNNKVIRLRQEMKYTIEKIQLQNNINSAHKKQKKISQMEEQKRDYYEITTLMKTGKCTLKIQSPQEAWNYLYLAYRFQSKFTIKLLQNQQSPSSSPLNNSEQQITEVIAMRRQTFQLQFLSLKEARVRHFIQECHGSLPATSLSLFFCEIAQNNEAMTSKLFVAIKAGLKALEASKFRADMILIYYFVMHQDSLHDSRIEMVIKLLYNAYQQNAKYFSEVDIIHQWLMKLTLVSKKFAEMIVKIEEGIEMLIEMIQKLDILKKPTTQMMKKQKNPTYERLNYLIHGLMVSTEYDDYEKLYESKKEFFFHLLHKKSLHPDYLSHNKIYPFIEPTYQELTKQIKTGDILLYLFNKKWQGIFVKLYKYGMLKVHKIIKDTEKNNKNTMIEERNEQSYKSEQSMHKHLTNFNVEQGYKLVQEQYTIWQTDERLKQYREHSYMEQLEKNTKNQGTKNSKINIEEEPDSSSNLSYQTNSGRK